MEIVTARPHRLEAVLAGRVQEAVRAGKRALVLVPSQETLRTEIMLMDALSPEGSFSIDVISPGRLRERVFDRAGRPDRVVFDERGKRMLLCGILEEEKDSLRVYARAAAGGQENLAARVGELISCLKQAGVSPEEMKRRAESSGEPLRGKLSELALLYARYEERIAGRQADAEDLLAEEEARLPFSRETENAAVFAAGFDLVTPSFARRLVMIAKEAPVCLLMETDRNAAPDGRLFAPVNASLDRLRRAAEEGGVPVTETAVNEPLDASPEIAFLEENLYALDGKKYEGEPRRVRLVTAGSCEREAHVTASSIRRLLAGGAHPDEIAVLFPPGSSCREHLAAVAPRYGISVYLAEKRPAASHPLSRYLLSALSMAAEGGWRLQELEECVKSGFSGVTEEEGNRFCAYCEEMDIRSGQLTRPFTWRTDAKMDEAALSALEDTRKRILGPLTALRSRLRAAENRDGALDACLRLLEETDAAGTLESMRRALEERGLSSEAEDCAQLWNALMETMDQLHETLPEDADPALVRRLLSGGLSALSLSALPPAEGAVLCGEIGNLRPGRVRHLFLMGMSDREGREPGGLFTARERAWMEENGVFLGMSERDRAAMDSLNLLKAMSTPTETLTVSWPLSDESGAALREGEAVRMLRLCFGNLKAEGGTGKNELRAMLSAEGPAAEALALYARETADAGRRPEPAFQGAAAALCGMETGREALSLALREMEGDPPARLSPQQARRLYGTRGEAMSVTRLETFAACPFLYYTRYGLRPREPRAKDTAPQTLGTLMHAAVDAFLKKAMARPEFPALSGEALSEVCAEADREAFAGWKRSPYGESRRGEAMARAVERRILRSAGAVLCQFLEGGYRPMGGEMTFGSGKIPPLVIELSDGSAVFLKGRIDRVDEKEGEERFIRVVDYKSGMKKVDPMRMYYGLQLQLALYMAAALRAEPGARPGGFYYFHLQDPTVSSAERDPGAARALAEEKMKLNGLSLGEEMGDAEGEWTDAEGMEAVLSFCMEKAAALAEEALSGAIGAEPFEYGEENACAHCEARAVCGFDPSRHSGKKLEAKTLKDLISGQNGTE